MPRTHMVAASGFNLGDYFQSLHEMGLSAQSTPEDIAVVAEREAFDLAANEPGSDVPADELEVFLSEWVASARGHD